MAKKVEEPAEETVERVAPATEPPTADELRRTIQPSLWEAMQGHAKKLSR